MRADRHVAGHPLQHEPRERGRERRQVGVQRRVDGEVEHLGLVAQQRERPRHVRPRRPDAGPGSRGSARARTPALVASSRHGQPALGAVRRRLRAREPEQRADHAARARGHAEQRPPPGRGERAGRGRSRPGRWPCGRRRSRPRACSRLRVADLPRPRLDVAARRARAMHAQRHAEPLAHGRAVRLVGVRLRPQPVVDVQRRHRPGAPHREVEQARRVAPARRRAPRPGLRGGRSRRPRQEQLGRDVEALQLHLADRLEGEVAPRRLLDLARDQDLAAGRPRADPRREVDRAPVVVAVAVQDAARVQADPRQRPLGRELPGSRPPSPRSADVSVPTTITSSPIVLITRASSGSVSATSSTKRSTTSSASSSPTSSVSRV